MKTLLEVALSQYGEKEIRGLKHSHIIINYAKEAGFTWVNDDETPWCSIFMNWVALKAGMERTKKANARSWLDIGEPTDNPQMGDVVIFKRGNNVAQGHVALFIKVNGMDEVYVLGGNQGNQVSIASYPLADVIGVRRLKKEL
jgi:uncharacterized protein (TIGR02594 family)